MESQSFDSTICINGNLQITTGERQRKTSDKKAYMREYMKTYMPNYKVDNPERTKVIDTRKYWRAKFKAVDLVINDNEELDKLSADDCHYIIKMRSAKKYMDQKPELFKYI